MNHSDYPTAKEADICLVLEGTYPFVGGGVSNWVYELIKAFPNYSFAVIFLGTQAEDYKELAYPIPKNVIHLEAHYLFENKIKASHTNRDIDSKSMKKVKQIHTYFGETNSCPIPDLLELFSLLDVGEAINEELFLSSRSTWNYILERYSKEHPTLSFFDYFWGVKNLHRPFWELAKIINNIPKVKILHSASTGYAGFLGALLQKKYQIPYVLTEHGLYTKERWLDLMRNYFFEHVISGQKPFVEEKDLLEIWLKFFSILAKIGYSAANPIISLFEAYRARQIADGAEPNHTKIISYGIDFSHYKFLGKEQPNIERPIIACVGRVVPIKDIKTFIRAQAIILQQIPDAEALIIGSRTYDKDYANECESLIKMLGLENKIKFTTTNNMMEIYPKLDLLLLCSISEGSPFVMLESMAVGIPVVATDVGGCSELIYGKNKEDMALGPAGKLVQINDPNALAKAAIELLTDKKAWRAAQQAGVKRLHTYYSMEDLVKNYGTIYRELGLP